MMTSLALFGNKVLRTAIQRNLVSFPAQVPAFAKHQADLQVRIIHLYFVAGWTIREIGRRYTMTPEMVRKSLSEWRVRAIASGYIQEIGPEVLPALASSSENVTDPDDDAAEKVDSVDIPRPSLQVVSVPAPQPEPEPVSILHMLLDEMEDSVEQQSYCERFFPRLLDLLKQECVQSGLILSTVQIERIEAAVEVQPENIRDLFRDLRNRVADEEKCTAVLSHPGLRRPGLLLALLAEIETSVLETSFQERDPGSENACGRLPTHCTRFLTALKQGCTESGMEFSLAQVKRIENALTTQPDRLGDLLRDLRNRLADEQEHTALICLPDRAPRHLTAGKSR
jgi:hypothetical protein